MDCKKVFLLSDRNFSDENVSISSVNLRDFSIRYISAYSLAVGSQSERVILCSYPGDVYVMLMDDLHLTGL